MPPTVVPMRAEASAIPWSRRIPRLPLPMCFPRAYVAAMARSVKDVEAYLTQLNRQFHEVDDKPGTYIIPSDGTQIALRCDPPLVVLRVHIGDVKKSDVDLPLFRRLLQLNARGLV